MKDLKVTDLVLQSFNLLDPEVAKDLDNLTSYAIDIRSKELPPDYIGDYVEVNPITTLNNSEFHQIESIEKSRESISASLGIKGSFGFYSASVQIEASIESSEEMKSSSASTTGFIQTGSVVFRKAIDSKILNLLENDFVEKFQSINSLQEAKDFIDLYGTHVALSWKLGGSFSILIDSQSESYEKETKINGEITATYKGIGSVEASVSAAYSLNQSEESSSITQTIFCSGGDPTLAGQINLNSEDSGINAWINSCSNDTAYGLLESKSFAELASIVGFDKSELYIQKYFDLAILKQSLENPTIYTAFRALNSSERGNLSVTMDGYRIIGGGASVTINSNSLLTSSYPDLENQNNNEVNAWNANSHAYGATVTSDFLTCYAIGIYDPGKCLQIVIKKEEGINPQDGSDSSTVSVPSDFILVGGGGTTTNKTNVKYLRSLFPEKSKDSENYDSWSTYVMNMKKGDTDATLSCYAIGIQCEHLEIKLRCYKSDNQTPQYSDGQSQVLGSKLRLIGGGAIVAPPTRESSWQMFLQQNIPTNLSKWSMYAKNTGSMGVCNAFALGLIVNIKGIVETD